MWKKIKGYEYFRKALYVICAAALFPTCSQQQVYGCISSSKSCKKSTVKGTKRCHCMGKCNEEAVSLDSNAALLNNKATSNRQGSEAITGVT